MSCVSGSTGPSSVDTQMDHSLRGQCRCLGHHKHLDCGLSQGRRSEELHEALVAALDKKTLWNEYGIVAGIIVRTSGTL